MIARWTNLHARSSVLLRNRCLKSVVSLSTLEISAMARIDGFGDNRHTRIGQI
jgi:hypothetical protein